MNRLDISMDLNERTVVWPKDEPPKLKPVCRMPEQPCNFTWLDFSAHAGTHIDAPYYLFPGQWTADQVPLERLIGPCRVVDLTAVPGTITAAALSSCEFDCERVLLKTRNSLDESGRYNPDHIDLDEEAARFLISRGVKTLGFDYQSFERGGETALHRIFLEKNITLIDNLRLGAAAAGRYFLICLPLKLTGTDAAPARAMLFEDAPWKS